MPATARIWVAGLLLGVWLAAAYPVGAAEESNVSPSPPARQAAEGAEGRPENSQTEPAPEEQTRPAARPKAAPHNRKTFRPSEEIHVDKAVDFPADI